MLPNRRSVFGARCGRLCLSFGSATLGLGRLVRPFHPGLSVWVTVHVFVLSFMFSLGGTFTLRAARLSLAHRILIQPLFSLSSPKGGEGGGEEATIIECPSPQPSPHSFLAGRGRKFLVVVSRRAQGVLHWTQKWMNLRVRLA